MDKPISDGRLEQLLAHVDTRTADLCHELMEFAVPELGSLDHVLRAIAVMFAKHSGLMIRTHAATFDKDEGEVTYAVMRMGAVLGNAAAPPQVDAATSPGGKFDFKEWLKV